MRERERERERELWEAPGPAAFSEKMVKQITSPSFAKLGYLLFSILKKMTRLTATF